jgi:hypothetical protein
MRDRAAALASGCHSCGCPAVSEFSGGSVSTQFLLLSLDRAKRALRLQISRRYHAVSLHLRWLLQGIAHWCEKGRREKGSRPAFALRARSCLTPVDATDMPDTP